MEEGAAGPPLDLAAAQAALLADRATLIAELGLDGGAALGDQKVLAAAAKEARKRGAAKQAKTAHVPVMARRSLRCVALGWQRLPVSPPRARAPRVPSFFPASRGKPNRHPPQRAKLGPRGRRQPGAP